MGDRFGQKWIRRRHWPVGLLVGLLGGWGCDNGHAVDARVVISIAELQQHAAQSAVAFDRVSLKVSAPDMEAPLVFVIDPSQLTFDIEVPAGAQRQFEVEARLGDVPVYWGVTVVAQLAPRSEIELEIPVFPAGGLVGTVTGCGGETVPEELIVSFTPHTPRPELPPSLKVVVSGAQLRATLPVGVYWVGKTGPDPGDVAGNVGNDDANSGQLLVVGEDVIISQGQITAGVTLWVTSPQTDHAGIDQLLTSHQLRAARDAYTCAALATPDDLEAAFGAALTRLALLPEHPAVDELLVACGQTPIDVERLLYSDEGGFISWFAQHREGSSDAAPLTLAFKSDAQTPFGPVTFVPNWVFSEWDHWGMEANEADVSLSLADLSNGAPDYAAIELSLWLDASWVDWSASPVSLAVGEQVQMDFFWEPAIGPDEQNDTYIACVQGTIEIQSADGGPPVAGQDWMVTFGNVICQRERWDQGPAPEVLGWYRLNGTVQDRLLKPYEPPPDWIPFGDLERDPGPPLRTEPIQVLEACGSAVDVPFLLSQLDRVFEEVGMIRGYLDRVGGSLRAATFAYDLPVGAVGNRKPLPFDVAMVHGLRAELALLAAMNETIQQYGYFSTAVGDLLEVVNGYYDCNDAGCVMVTAIDVNWEAWVADLNREFLSHAAPITTEPLRAGLREAIAALRLGLLATPVSGRLISFQRDNSTRQAAAELVASLNHLESSMETGGDWTLGPTDGYVVHFYQYLENPFDRQSLRAAMGDGVAEEDLWTFVPASAVEEENARVEPHPRLLDEMGTSVMTWPETTEPDPRVYCDSEVDCVAPWACVGQGSEGACGGDNGLLCWGDYDCAPWCEGIYCSDNPGQPCTIDRDCWGNNICEGQNCQSDMSPCASDEDCWIAGWRCWFDYCAYPEPVFFDKAKVDPAFDGSLPAFFDPNVLSNLD